jgi:hypothetical protein
MFVKSEKGNPSGPRLSATKCPCVTPGLAVMGGNVCRVRGGVKGAGAPTGAV